jgi:hypothetical protein
MSLLSQLSFLGHFWQEKTNKKIFIWNVVFILLQLGLLFWKFNDLPTSVPLYYSLPWGQSQLASLSALFLLPAFSLIIGLANSILALSLFSSIKLLSRLLVIFSLIFSILVFVSLFQIINLVG